jgi:hypothetical protein
MRKELKVFISTSERNEEISVTSILKNRSILVFDNGINKFTANKEELLEAIKSIEEFDKENNVAVNEVSIVSNEHFEVEYGSDSN